MKLSMLAMRAEAKNLPAIIISIGLCLVLFWIGALKITPTEAEGISPLVTNSPLIGWTYLLFGKQGGSIFIGIFEYITGIGIIAGFFKPSLGLVAAVMAMMIFFVTSSFFLTTPGTLGMTDSVYGPTHRGEFLLKDVALFGAAMYLFTFFGRRAE